MAAPLTPSQTVGPFFAVALPYEGGGEVVAPDAPGALTLTGRVLDGAGAPVTDALLEIWQPAPAGQAASGARAPAWFGRSATDSTGRFRFVVAKPPGPTDPRGRSHAPHLDLVVFARGLLRQLLTRVYFPDELAANEVDPVLAAVPAGRRATLVARAEDGGLRHDVRLQGDGETIFFAG